MNSIDVSENENVFAVWFELLEELTGALGALAHLKLHASVELSGNQPVGYNHHHSRDEEQNEEQQHVPREKAEWEDIGVKTCRESRGKDEGR